MLTSPGTECTCSSVTERGGGREKGEGRREGEGRGEEGGRRERRGGREKGEGRREGEGRGEETFLLLYKAWGANELQLWGEPPLALSEGCPDVCAPPHQAA